MEKIDLSLILPCFNEEAIFTDSVKMIRQILDLSKLTYEIIFVDDRSSDNTADLIRKAIKKWKNAKAVYHLTNQGRGRAVVDGIHQAKGEVAGYIDIDLEVSPVYIPSIVKMIKDKQSDFIVGKRVYRTNAPSISREIFSAGYRLLINRVFETNNIDTESGYKFFNRRKILPVLDKTSHPHWFWDTEIVVYALRAKLEIVEVPVLFLRRFDKQSTVRPIRDIMDYVVNIIKLNNRLNNKSKVR